MRDNRTSQPASEYDGNIEKTIPFYRMFHKQTVELVSTHNPEPQTWLDTGCGTGRLVLEAAKVFTVTQFTLADPSGAMLEIAQEKLSAYKQCCTYVLGGTEEITFPDNTFDVITAILAHHYVVPEVRSKITAACYRMLKPGGIYITFESIRPRTDAGLKNGLARWQREQLAAGKSSDAVAKHISRYGVEFLPITVAEHLTVMGNSGFAAVELFWTSYMQAGFYGIK